MMNIQGKDTVTLRGVGIGAGSACGRLKFYQRNSAVVPQVSSSTPVIERERLSVAREKARERIDFLRGKALREIGEKEAEIFEIHGMLIQDEDFSELMEELILGGASAEEAADGAARKYAEILRALPDPYLSARAADLGDIARHILSALREQESSAVENDTEAYILVADDLAPSETVLLDKSKILGFVTFFGTPNSHTAILARAMGIPALIGVGKMETSMDGEMGLLSASEGILVVSPDEGQVDSFQKKIGRESELAREHEKYMRSLINRPAITRGGRKLLIYANVGESADVDSALLNGAEGIGLLRSEFLYLTLDRYPTEEELFESYRAVVSKMEGKRVIVRTLDIGADKTAGYFGLQREENPALGFRGVRLCLGRVPMFKTQLRAILRASAYGRLSIMVPMIVSAEEVRRCRRLLEESMSELKKEGKSFDPSPEFGIMVETPAAALMSEELAAEVDFFSVGTNDLLQYTLAADRQNAAVASLCEENHEPVLRLIAMACEAIHRHDGWIGICGELAADLRLTQRFVDMGVDELSVSPPYLLGVREKVTECR